MALSAPLFFPWHVSLVLAAIASLIVPPLGLVVGMFTDTLYWTSGSVPYATLIGLVFTVLA